MGGVASLDGVDYSAVYNYDYYISHNGDVAAAFAGDDVAALRHFVRYGMAEGRQGCEGFDVNSYKNEYADLRAAYGGDLTSYYLHYVDYGAAEGRHGTGCNQLTGAVTSLNGVDYSAVYNYDYYISHNGDIAAAFGGDDVCHPAALCPARHGRGPPGLRELQCERRIPFLYLNIPSQISIFPIFTNFSVT